jgi:hypothetical protein
VASTNLDNSMSRTLSIRGRSLALLSDGVKGIYGEGNKAQSCSNSVRASILRSPIRELRVRHSLLTTHVPVMFVYGGPCLRRRMLDADPCHRLTDTFDSLDTRKMLPRLRMHRRGAARSDVGWHERKIK